MNSSESKTGKKTRERLSASPFSSMEEMKAAQKQIKMEVWTESERARFRKDLIEQEEYEFVRKAFEKGWVTETSGKGPEIARIRSDSDGVIRISWRRRFESAPNSAVQR